MTSSEITKREEKHKSRWAAIEVDDPKQNREKDRKIKRGNMRIERDRESKAGKLYSKRERTIGTESERQEPSGCQVEKKNY